MNFNTSKKFYIDYREIDKNWKQCRSDFFYYEQKIYQKKTIRDVKEYVKEQRYKKHEPVCTCQLEVWYFNKETNPKTNLYNDDTYLDNTIFDEFNKIWVIQRKEKKCTCGQLEKLLISSNYEKQREEDKRLHQNEINCLRNMINQ